MAQADELAMESGVAALTLPGEQEAGDRHLIATYPGGALLAAIDGLGHGQEAALAAQRAVEVLRQHCQESLIALVRLCHERLQGTRGVVMSLAAFDARDRTLTWLAIGNVTGVLLHRHTAVFPAQDTLTLRAGVVGFQLPQLIAESLAIEPGATLILATDGVRSGFTSGWLASGMLPAEKLANHILSQHASRNDDALVMVARFLAAPEV